MQLSYIQLIGGIMLLIVSYKLLADKQGSDPIKHGETLREAVTIIILADVIMSLDNVLAVAAIAGNNITLIITGIALSLPIILLASDFILKLIRKYPVIIYIGAAFLAWTAGEMMLKEKLVMDFLKLDERSSLLFLCGITLLTLMIGGLRRRRNFKASG